MAGWNEWIPGTNMTLTEVLDALKSARVGLDVKDKLYWSFYKMMELAIKEGNANFDVAKAAGTFKDLASRLDASDNDLRNFNVNWINKNLAKLDASFFTDDFLTALANGEINVTNLLDGSVTISKTAFIQESTNLFNVDTLNLGQSLVEATGALTPNPQYAVSDYIPIRGDHYIAVKVVGAGGISLYDQDFNHLETHKISSSVGQLVIPTAVTARWARVQTDMTHINQTQLNIGSTLQPYESHYAKLDPLINPLDAYMTQDGKEF